MVAALAELAISLLLCSTSQAYSARDFPHHHHGMGYHQPPPPGEHGPQPGSTMGNATFDQLIDHANPSLGTFKQFYYWSSEYYAGSASPIVMFTPGEINATGYQTYLGTNRTTGVVAQQIGAGVIVLEHRYWGTSSPYEDLTTENMKYLTLENSIKDLTYFAQHVRLPFDPHQSSAPSKAPWVMMGGSYSGALAAWTESVSPGVYWAYLASSAPVQAISDYWAYFAPVQLGMPKNCSTDVALVIDHIDEVGSTGSVAEQQALKEMFGLGSVEHFDDFVGALENGPWLWQGNQFYRTTGFYDWCDAIENVDANSTVLPSASGVGLEKALAGYANWVNTTLIPGYCEGYGYFEGERNTDCFSTYDASSPIFTDTTLSNTVDRQWTWMICNEAFGYWQDGAPSGRPSLVSRFITAEYWTRQCSLYFPGFEPMGTAESVNAYTKGWDTRPSQRLVYTNGGYDPWRDSGVSSDQRPGGRLQSTSQVPVNVVPGGFHTSDLITKNGQVNAGCKAVIDAEVQQLVQWVNEFPQRGDHGHGGGYGGHRGGGSGNGWGNGWKSWSA